ncbi:E3 Ubiquitin ligase [Amycolatopsis arida]|uniref:RING-type E3 ubiquitin transferase n=1 Tax=Amycolatopsis arida TaxID=587909 RepID=A0A1I5WYI5_9PSEU|nr:GIDE domain-containing protein [Amycolatopsis arida]TDX92512.1 E3 ubiquitin ligase [Amycolatopsis arida]SFQ24744.1 E3 Ubiquitin ligase [Amycolatopsis arida]
MWIVGLVLVVAGVVGFFFMRHLKSELHTMIGTETLSVPELERFRSASDEVGAKGSFRKVAEVVGAAHPGPDGPLVAELSGAECVWYRYRVDRKYEKIEYRDGRRIRRTATEKVAEYTSWQGYAVIDDQGRTIGVDPGGNEPDRPEQTVDRFEPASGRRSVELFGIRLPGVSGGDSTIGYHYKEWLIRSGRRLYVLGEVHDRIGPLVIGKPERGGHFIISTRDEQALRAERVLHHRIVAVGVVVATLGGLALTVAGLIG